MTMGRTCGAGAASLGRVAKIASSALQQNYRLMAEMGHEPKGSDRALLVGFATET